MRVARFMVPAMSVTLLLAAVVGAQATQPNEIRRDPHSSASSDVTLPGVSATRVAISLAAVLTLIIVLFYAGRRFLPRSAFTQQAGSAVQVLARTAISPKQRVILLQVGRRILIIADSGQSLATLGEITQPDEAAALIAQLQSDKAGGSFATALNDAMERFRTAEPKPTESQPDVNSMRHEVEGLAERMRGMVR